MWSYLFFTFIVVVYVHVVTSYYQRRIIPAIVVPLHVEVWHILNALQLSGIFYQLYAYEPIYVYPLSVRILELLCSVIFSDIYFYSTHRLLHVRFWFSYIHSWHHEVTEVYPWATLYAHPLENLLVNGGVAFIPAWYYQWNAFIAFLWLLFIFHNSLEAHTNRAGKHAQHHRFLSYNFGLQLFMDYLLGTTLL